MNGPIERGSEARPSDVRGRERWGLDAPWMLRFVALVAWLAAIVRLLSGSLPGSRSGIEALIRRADAGSSVLSQLTVLLGTSQLVLLVVTTLVEPSFGYVYRILIVPAAAAVVLLVMLASTSGLEPELSLLLAVSAILLAAAGASASIKSRVARAHGLVLLAVTLAAALRFGTRLLDFAAVHADASYRARLAWMAGFGRMLDALGVSLAAVRLIAERRTSAGVTVFSALALATFIAWGGLRGSLDGAALWQVLASRSLGDLSASSALGASTSHYAVDSFALLLGGAVALWPGHLSLGMVSAALVILARPGADVPACALVLALGALASPLSGARGAAPQAAPEVRPASGEVPRGATGTDA